MTLPDQPWAVVGGSGAGQGVGRGRGSIGRMGVCWLLLPRRPGLVSRATGGGSLPWRGQAGPCACLVAPALSDEEPAARSKVRPPSRTQQPAMPASSRGNANGTPGSLRVPPFPLPIRCQLLQPRQGAPIACRANPRATASHGAAAGLRWAIYTCPSPLPTSDNTSHPASVASAEHLFV